MRSITSIVTAFLGLSLFVLLFPFLLWLVAIIAVCLLAGLLYFRYKIRKAQKEMESQFDAYQNEYNEDATYYYREANNSNPDVFDVEFREREEE
ncbi:MAG: hypothetical protein ACRCZJ_05815 [Erysipelotrichaceae bacterium]